MTLGVPVACQLDVVPPLPADAAAQGPRDRGERSVSLKGIGDGYPADTAVPEPQGSRGPVDHEYPVLAACEDEVGHRGPLMFLAVSLAQRQRRREQAPLGTGQVKVLAGER